MALKALEGRLAPYVPQPKVVAIGMTVTTIALACIGAGLHTCNTQGAHKIGKSLLASSILSAHGLVGYLAYGQLTVKSAQQEAKAEMTRD